MTHASFHMPLLKKILILLLIGSLLLVGCDTRERLAAAATSWVQDQVTRTPTPTATPWAHYTWLSDLQPVRSVYVAGSPEIGAIGGSPLTAFNISYPHGILAHAPASQTFDLQGRFDRFITDLAFSDDPNLEARCGNGAYFVIMLDGRVLFQSPYMNFNTPPIPVDVDVSGGELLRLDTYTTQDALADNACDWTFWGDPRLMAYTASGADAPPAAALPSPTLPPQGAAYSFYVSPNGDDAGPGSFEQPFATLRRAQESVRLVNRDMTADIHVYLMGGMYRLPETLTFAPEDSGTNGFSIHYEAWETQVPVLSGGVEVWGFTPVAGKDYWRLTLPAEIAPFRNLYVNGARASRARTGKPIAGNGWVEGPVSPTDGILMSSVGTGWWFSRWADFGSFLRQDELPAFSKPGDLELHWVMDRVDLRLPAAGIQPLGEGQFALMMRQPFFSWARGLQDGQEHAGAPRWDVPFTLENAIELLDSPGEWYYDADTRDLYYYPRPGETTGSTTALVPQLEQLMVIEGRPDAPVQNLVFSGLAFSHNSWMRASLNGTASLQAQVLRDGVGGPGDLSFLAYTPAAVQLEHARNIHLMDNTFRQLGSVGIGLDNDVRQVALTGNLFQDLSDSAVTLSQGARHAVINGAGEAAVSDISIENNLIDGVGVEYTGAPGIAVYFVDHVTIAHNLIRAVNSSGILLGWNSAYLPASTSLHDNLVTNNRIENVALGGVNGSPEFGGDAGGIQAMGSQPGTLIQGNYVGYINHNQPCYYLDGGSASLSLQDNLCDRAGLWLKIGAPDVHDISIQRSYTNVGGEVNNGTNIAITDTFFVTALDWPAGAMDILARAGLEAEYLGLMERGK